MILKRKDFRYITLAEIGEVHLKRSNRAKRVIVSVKTSNSILVTVPRFISFKKAESFVIAKSDWIVKHQKKIDDKIDISTQIDSISIDAKQQLINRIRDLSVKYQFNYNKITIKKMRSRWGSCSDKNNISLNLGLFLLPDKLQEYVILHELVHTEIKNHSSKFWMKLSSIIPDAKVLRRQLNKDYKL